MRFTRGLWQMGGVLLLLMVVLAATAGSARAEASGQKFIVSVDNISNFTHKFQTVFNTPSNRHEPGPLLPNQSYVATVYGDPGDRLSFATMLVQTNDWFFAPDEMGIPLYDASGHPMNGDVTDYVKLWDGGTEADEPFGVGPNQAPRQSGPNTGPADPDSTVRQVSLAGAPVGDLIRVRITSHDSGRFTLRIRNVSGQTMYASPLAPGVAVVHHSPAPLFIAGQPDFGLGVEAIAEDGSPAGLAAALHMITGINTPLAPVAWVVHPTVDALFTPGTAASAGLEVLAEDGNPAVLVAELPFANKGAQAIGRGASGPGPIFAPDGNYSFEITAAPGDHLSLATMFVQSNDWFFSIRNLPLFDSSGNPRSGDVTGYAVIYDAGTEKDQEPGFGSFQAPRQPGPNTGPVQHGVIAMATHPAAASPGLMIHITVTPVP